MSGVATNIAPLLLIAALITIHEFGHFLVAKACGVRVVVFSIGIGGRLFGFKRGDTDYRVSWFPFGGYVRMAGADPFMDGGGDEGDDISAPGSFMSRPAWQRVLVVLAGPAMNIALPFVVFTALKMVGEPQPRSDVLAVQAGSPAAEAGIQPEDRVVSVNGEPVATWYDMNDAFEAAKGPTVDLVVDRAGQPVPVSLKASDAPDPIGAGLRFRTLDATVGVDDPASPAAKAGLRTGDVIEEVDGAPVYTWGQVVRRASAALDRPLALTVRRAGAEDGPIDHLTIPADPAWSAAATAADDAVWHTWGIVSAEVIVAPFGDAKSAAKDAGVEPGDRLLEVDGHPIRAFADIVAGVAASATGEGSDQTTRPVNIVVRRDGQVRTFVIKPEVVKDTDDTGRYRYRALLGIGSSGTMYQAPPVTRRYSLVPAFSRATEETVAIAGFMVERIGELLTGEAPVDKNLGGPVRIFQEARAAAERGAYDFARQLGLFSLSIGIFNLLPVPVLDGGQLVMYLAEWVRGRPLPLILRERALQAGVILVVLLFLYVMANDLRQSVMG